MDSSLPNTYKELVKIVGDKDEDELIKIFDDIKDKHPSHYNTMNEYIKFLQDFHNEPNEMFSYVLYRIVDFDYYSEREPYEEFVQRYYRGKQSTYFKMYYMFSERDTPMMELGCCILGFKMGLIDEKTYKKTRERAIEYTKESMSEFHSTSEDIEEVIFYNTGMHEGYLIMPTTQLVIDEVLKYMHSEH